MIYNHSDGYWIKYFIGCSENSKQEVIRDIVSERDGYFYLQERKVEVVVYRKRAA